MHRKFDESFKIMAVDLSVVRGSVSEVAKELEIDPSLLSKWRRNPRYNGNKVLPDNPKISPEEQELRILREKLRDAELERDILKYHPGTNTFGVMDASGVPELCLDQRGV